MTIKLVKNGEEGELVLEGRLDSVTSTEAEEVFAQYAKAAGIEGAKLTDTTGTDKNRKFIYKDKDGNDQEVTLETMKDVVAQDMAMNGNIDAEKEALKRAGFGTKGISQATKVNDEAKDVFAQYAEAAGIEGATLTDTTGNDKNRKFVYTDKDGNELEMHKELINNIEQSNYDCIAHIHTHPYAEGYYSSYPSNQDLYTYAHLQENFNQTDRDIFFIGGSQKWVHKHLALSPFEVLKAFKKADFVITDTFHGTIFSAKYAKKFGVIVRDSNRNKLSDLISRLGIEKQEIKDIENLESLYINLVDRKGIDEIIKEERHKTLEYLEKSL
jgi:2-hydroxychromene-2-carboxylate isomerase